MRDDDDDDVGNFEIIISAVLILLSLRKGRLASAANNDALGRW